MQVGTPKLGCSSDMSAPAHRRRDAAVGMKDRPGERCGFVAAQEQRCVGNVEWRWQPTPRKLTGTLVGPRRLCLRIIAYRIADDPGQHLRLDVCGPDCV